MNPNLNRNTYDSKPNQIKSNPNIKQTKQRQTYTAGNPKILNSVGKQNPIKPPDNIEKMTKNIIETLKRFPLSPEIKSLAPNTIRQDKKTIVSILATLFKSIDNVFQESNVNLELLPDQLKLIGYPYVILKTYFQPIGAQHTWNHVVTMMDWLSELAILHLQTRNQLQEGQFQEDLSSLFIEAHLKNDLNIPKIRIQKSIAQKVQQIDDLRYYIKTNELQIENIKTSQKDIPVMEEQKKRLESILNRETQQVIQILNQNQQMQRRKKQLLARIEEQRRMAQIHDNEISSLTREIQTQQLSVDEVEKIRFKIKQQRDKIAEMKRFHELEKQNLDKVDNNIMDEYIEFNKVIEAFRLIYSKYQKDIEKRNIYMNIPQSDVAGFSEFVKGKKDNWSSVRAQQLTGIKELRDINQKGDKLVKQLLNQLKKIQLESQRVQVESRTINQECLMRSIKVKQLRAQLQKSKQKLSEVKRRISETQVSNMQWNMEFNRIQQENKQALKEKQQILQETEDLSKQTMEAASLKKRMEKQVNESLQEMEQKLNDMQLQYFELLENDCEYFQVKAQEGYAENNEDKINEVFQDKMQLSKQQENFPKLQNLTDFRKQNKEFDSPPSQKVNKPNQFWFYNQKR